VRHVDSGLRDVSATSRASTLQNTVTVTPELINHSL
jgi:hypothetical protein